jgi:hypothetical protein
MPTSRRETAEIDNEQYQRTVVSEDHHRKHRPERDQEQVEKPTHARREHANNGKEPDLRAAKLPPGYRCRRITALRSKQTRNSSTPTRSRVSLRSRNTANLRLCARTVKEQQPCERRREDRERRM